MKSKWIVLDVPCLMWRGHHSKKNLQFNGQLTGAAFGLMQDILEFQELFDTSNLVFTFDRGPYLRCKQFAAYKADRHQREQMSKEERLARKAVRQQMRLLRTDHLKRIGFKNVFSKNGYEADDVIASVASSLAAAKHRVVIVSNDKDLYQCLSPRVEVYNPTTTKLLTYDGFYEEHGIEPTRWIDVLSIVGGHDNIQGIKGVGIKTALAFLKAQLKEHTKGFQAIVKGDKIWKFNRDLIELPFPGLPEFVIHEDEISEAGWRSVAKELGIRSLIARSPVRDKDYRKRLIKKRG